MRPRRFAHAIFGEAMRALPIEEFESDDAFRDGGGAVSDGDGVARDIAEQKMIERACRQAVENERRRIGQELHDDLCQNLLGAAFALKAVAENLPPASSNAVELELLARLVNAAVQQARDIVQGLNPGELSDSVDGGSRGIRRLPKRS